MLKQTFLKIGAITLAIAMGTGFVLNKAGNGNALHRIRNAGLLLDSPTIAMDSARLPGTVRTAAFTADLARKGLAVDLFYSGAIITLDSLKRRVERDRILMLSSKSGVVGTLMEAEWNYLDSLLIIANEHEAQLVVRTKVIPDKYRGGGMITVDSLDRRVKSERYMFSGSKAARGPYMRWEKDVQYLDSILGATPK